MSVEVVIGILGVVLSVLTFVVGRISVAKNDGKSEGKQDGQILSELGYLRSSTDEIKRRLDKQDERDRDYITRLVAVEASAKQAHRRLDEMQGFQKRDQ